VLVFVLGISLIVYARNDRRSDDLGGVPQLGDHIHQAIGFDICGVFQPNIPEFETPVGIHTHGDGVLHIHPFSQLGVGANATLGRFFKNARDDGGLKISLSNTKLSYLGTDTTEGKTKCEGVKNPELRVAYWKHVGDATEKPTVTTGGFTDLRLTDDGGGFTIFYGDAKADIPRPETADKLAELGAKDGGQTPDSNGSTTTSTAPVADTSSTTAPADAGSTTTVAP
jgi:hypothetical protein